MMFHTGWKHEICPGGVIRKRGGDVESRHLCEPLLSPSPRMPAGFLGTLGLDPEPNRRKTLWSFKRKAGAPSFACPGPTSRCNGYSHRLIAMARLNRMWPCLVMEDWWRLVYVRNITPSTFFSPEIIYRHFVAESGEKSDGFLILSPTSEISTTSFIKSYSDDTHRFSLGKRFSSFSSTKTPLNQGQPLRTLIKLFVACALASYLSFSILPIARVINNKSPIIGLGGRYHTLKQISSLNWIEANELEIDDKSFELNLPDFEEISGDTSDTFKKSDREQRMRAPLPLRIRATGRPKTSDKKNS
ncbi:hypothetical protein BY996DRAFT_6556490 [Phakopsora pachyrhizi]|nr:hypothetical protein BY996DRAFT_6556490 [Phakopsora pachyrhizi]